MRKMIAQMIVKFEIYWSKFNVMLAIANILDHLYKFLFIDFSYKKLYGPSSLEYLNKQTKMTSLFMEYTYGAPIVSNTTFEANVNKVNAQFQTFMEDTIVMQENIINFCLISYINIVALIMLA